MCNIPDSLKKQLIQREPKTSVVKLIEYIQKYNNLELSDFPNMDAQKKALIEKKLSELPNPTEQEEWKKIEPSLTATSQQVLDSLNEYIKKWEGTRPAGNHVDEAWTHFLRIQNELDEIARTVEKNDWDSLDVTEKKSLLDYLSKYPDTVHKEEIGNIIWDLENKEIIADIEEYKNLFPKGTHYEEAQKLLDAILEWDKYKSTNNIFLINEYICKNPNTPFKQQALLTKARLKQEEIRQMHENPNEYDVNRLMDLINNDIITDEELINSDVMTANILETLRTADITSDLPDIKKAIADSTAECKDGYKDVFFFGVPSTGKTCVLMGLSSSNNLDINFVAGGGDYASALQQYTDFGLTVPRTPGTCVTTLEGTISSANESGIVYKVNLVEMSGEEFAFSIAGNPDHVFTFEEMGTGATELLKNDNRKVFFLIIDPTVNVVHIQRERILGYDEQSGDPIIKMDDCKVNQRILIQKMVNLFQYPENRDIMKKVDSIHIIMTKSDTLGNPVDREEKALKIFNEKYAANILGPLKNLCREYNINSNNNFLPKLFTFSLGRFYVGGLYEYEQTDSDRLVKAIMNSTGGITKTTIWDKIKRKLN